MTGGRETPEGVVQLLLAEHQQSYEMYRYSEELGERRFNFFLTLITAVIAALVVADEPVVDGDDVAPAAYLLLFGLLLVGAVTLRRIASRNDNSFAQLRAIERIRDFFDDLDPEALSYLDFHRPRVAGEARPVSSGRMRRWREILSTGKGGLDVTTRVINVLIAGGLAGLALVDVGAPVAAAVAGGAVAAAVAWALQFAALNRYHRTRDAERAESERKRELERGR